MSFRQKCCFFDLPSVITIVPGGVSFDKYLPGFLGDLFSMYGALVGLAFTDWVARLPGGIVGLRDELYEFSGMPPFRLVELPGKDPMSSLWDVPGRMSLDLQRCTLCLGPDADRMEKLARDAGIGRFQVFDSRYIL